MQIESECIILDYQNGYWAGASYPVDAYIQTYICPASYCICKAGKDNSCIGVFSQNDTENNKQCHPTRKGIKLMSALNHILKRIYFSGILCGQCINGTAVGVLRRNCRTCEHETFYALPLIGEIFVPLLLHATFIFVHGKLFIYLTGSAALHCACVAQNVHVYNCLPLHARSRV